MLSVLAAAFGATACAHKTTPALPSAAPPVESVVIFASGAPCTNESGIEADALSAASVMKSAFERLGFASVEVVPHAEHARILAEVARPSERPRIFAFAGHAALAKGSFVDADPQRSALTAACVESGEPCSSVLCFEDGVVALDRLISAPPAANPFSLFIVDACTSAHVDVRAARGNVAVISASPVAVALPLGGGTLLSDGFTRLPPSVDLDCDGAVEDWELFVALTSTVEQSGYRAALPKLRRQVRGRVPFLASPPASGSCRMNAVAVREAPSDRIEEYTDDTGRSLVRTEGLVLRESVLPLGGVAVGSSELVALPCERDEGQCFRRR